MERKRRVHHLRCSPRGGMAWRGPRRRVQVTSFRASSRYISRSRKPGDVSLRNLPAASYFSSRPYRDVSHRVTVALTSARRRYLRCISPLLLDLPVFSAFRSDIKSSTPREGRKVSTFCYPLHSPFFRPLSFSFLPFFSSVPRSFLILGQTSFAIVLRWRACSSREEKMAGLGSKVFTTSREIEFTKDPGFPLWFMASQFCVRCFRLKPRGQMVSPLFTPVFRFHLRFRRCSDLRQQRLNSRRIFPRS